MRPTRLAFLVLAAPCLLACAGPANPARDAGPSGMDAARVPACETSGPEDGAAACSDGCDNEPDGVADCDDFGCCGVRRDCPPTSACGALDAGPAGRDAQVVECPTMGPETSAEACSNACDDDGNGFADCDDFDCCDLVACAADTSCGRLLSRDGGAPMRFDAGGVIENTAELCTNGMDDDGDGYADCDDFGCCARTSCGPTTACGRRGDAGPPRDGGSAPRCSVRTPENTLGACSNGCDDDGNGFFDCGDRNCCLVRAAGGMACGTGTYCGERFMAGDVNLCPGDDVTMPPGREATLTACSNGCDDDRNGFEDCQDRGCCLVRTAGGMPCGAGTYCGERFMAGDVNLCPGDDVTMPPRAESSADACRNGCDDDRDGYEDCEDRDCCEVRTDCAASTFCGRA